MNRLFLGLLVLNTLSCQASQVKLNAKILLPEGGAQGIISVPHTILPSNSVTARVGKVFSPPITPPLETRPSSLLAPLPDTLSSALPSALPLAVLSPLPHLSPTPFSSATPKVTVGSDTACQSVAGDLVGLDGTATELNDPCQSLRSRVKPTLPPTIHLEGDLAVEGVTIQTVPSASPSVLTPPFKRGSHLAFVKTSSQQIMLTDFSGTAKPVTPPGYRAAYPVWSSDGAMLTFASNYLQRGGDELFQITPLGRLLRRLTFQYLNVRPLDWSVKNEILFVQGDQLYVLNVDTNQTQAVLRDISVTAAVWSPDGTQLALNQAGHLAMMGREGNAYRLLLANAQVSGGLDWSGENIVYESQGNLMQITLNGGFPQRLSNQQDSQPVYSPDGTQLAFVSMRTGKSAIYVMDVAGQEAARLVQENALQPAW